MRKKLVANSLWESSRMMLPEHIVSINEHAYQQKKRSRIHLDEQEWESISKAVEKRRSVKRSYYD